MGRPKGSKNKNVVANHTSRAESPKRDFLHMIIEAQIQVTRGALTTEEAFRTLVHAAVSDLMSK
jgi:hypothetical protein